MVNIHDMLGNDDIFLQHFCSETTLERMGGMPAWVLREVVKYIFDNVAFRAAASPRQWTPEKSPQPLISVGFLTANGSIKGKRKRSDEEFRFGLCTNVACGESGDVQALHLWAGQCLTEGGPIWESWREAKCRLASPVAEKIGGTWVVKIADILPKTRFIEKAKEVGNYVPTRAAQSRLEPILRQIGQCPSFMAPRAIDTYRH
mgnify:CR=1 FL=1